MQNKKISIFTKKYWKSQWKNALINASVYIGIFIIFALIDLLTKRNYYIPADYRDSEAIYSFGQPGAHAFLWYRTVFHAGTTLELGLGNVGLHIISFIIIFATFIGSLFFKNHWYIFVVAGLAVTAAGSLGNMYDRFQFQGVRDIIYFPWIDKGTFNFADSFLICGGIGTIISAIIIGLCFHNKQNKSKEEQLANDKNVDSENTFDSTK